VLITIFRVIFWSMACQMAMAGNYAMAFLPVFAACFRAALRWWLYFLGYNQAKKIATSITTDIKDLTEGACILGLAVVGAMSASMVSAQFASQIVVGSNPDGTVVTRSLQSLVDSIFPAFLPLCIVLFGYWALGKKSMNPVKLLLVLFVGGIILHNLGILA